MCWKRTNGAVVVVAVSAVAVVVAKREEVWWEVRARSEEQAAKLYELKTTIKQLINVKLPSYTSISMASHCSECEHAEAALTELTTGYRCPITTSGQHTWPKKPYATGKPIRPRFGHPPRPLRSHRTG